MNDQQTTIDQLRCAVRQFVDERNWRQFHAPKNLAMAVAIEAAELMEHFQWLTPDASRQVAADPDGRNAVGEEMADVLCYLLALADELELDLSAALEAKLAKNCQKYPVAEYRGRYGPGDANRPQ
jgi:dCTP diphosphatase